MCQFISFILRLNCGKDDSNVIVKGWVPAETSALTADSLGQVKVGAGNVGCTCQTTLSQPACYFSWLLIIDGVKEDEIPPAEVGT